MGHVNIVLEQIPLAGRHIVHVLGLHEYIYVVCLRFCRPVFTSKMLKESDF